MLPTSLVQNRLPLHCFPPSPLQSLLSFTVEIEDAACSPQEGWSACLPCAETAGLPEAPQERSAPSCFTPAAYCLSCSLLKGAMTSDPLCSFCWVSNDIIQLRMTAPGEVGAALGASSGMKVELKGASKPPGQPSRHDTRVWFDLS